MKKIIIAMAAMAAVTSQAQTLDDGIKMYKYERYATAEKILAPLAVGNSIANYYYGLSQLADNNIDGAKATFTKFPEDPANMSGLARVAFALKNAAAGNQINATIVQKAKKKDWLPYQYAADAITYSDNADMNNLQQAITWYKKALELVDNADVHISEGDAYQKMPGGGGGGEAMNNYEHVTEKDAKNSLAFSRIGKLWYDARNYPSALDNYAKAKDADPKNPLPYRDLANAYERVGKYDQSLQNMQQYLALSDKSVADMVQYLEILYLSKHYNEAAKLGDSLVNVGVKKAGVYGIVGFSQFELNDLTNATKNVRYYIALKGASNVPYNDFVTFGKIFSASNMDDSADYYYAKAAAMDTARDKSDLYRPIAENYRMQKKYPTSAKWYNRIITENPAAQPTDYFWAGAMQYYGKNYRDAATAFEKMENKYPDQPSATYWRGRVASAVDSEAKEGTAIPFYTKWIEKVGPNYDKKNDLKIAYEYMLIYYFNKKDKENESKYKELLKGIDPADSTLKQIIEIESSPAKKSTAPAPKKKKN